MISDFIMNQFFVMKWLNTLIGNLLNTIRIDIGMCYAGS